MTLVFTPMPRETARRLQAGGTDAYGQTPERAVSDGDGIPCRHCLTMIPAGVSYLIFAHRPFSALQPYAETGPAFLCAHECEAPEPTSDMPEILDSPTYIVRGYGADERIAYGTGGVIATGDITKRAEQLFENPAINFVHVRSASNNCYHVRIDRA